MAPCGTLFFRQPPKKYGMEQQKAKLINVCYQDLDSHCIPLDPIGSHWYLPRFDLRNFFIIGTHLRISESDAGNHRSFPMTKMLRNCPESSPGQFHFISRCLSKMVKPIIAKCDGRKYHQDGSYDDSAMALLHHLHGLSNIIQLHLRQ